MARKTLSNGAVVEVLANGRYKFVSGPVKGSGRGVSKPRKSLSPERAKAAFAAYWRQRLAATKGSPRRRSATKAAQTRDLAYNSSPARLVKGRTYLANPGKYEFEGVDYFPGNKTYKKASGKRLAALSAGRAARSASWRTKAGATRSATAKSLKGKKRAGKSPKQLAAARLNIKKAQAARSPFEREARRMRRITPQ